MLAVIAVMIALGTWQVRRLAWKRDLIARVDTRVHASAASLPAMSGWADITVAADEYRHVVTAGTFLPLDTLLVQSVTDYGGGFWVMTPLREQDGGLVFINRGFVPADRRDPTGWRALPEEATTVTGLLRMSEPHGGFLRANEPAAGRWFSRDTQAMAAARKLGATAPFFIDAEKSPDETGLPIAGLTVIEFPNNHLVYALTWYGLALLLVVFGANALRGGAVRGGAVR